MGKRRGVIAAPHHSWARFTEYFERNLTEANTVSFHEDTYQDSTYSL